MPLFAALAWAERERGGGKGAREKTYSGVGDVEGALRIGWM